jgi:DHA1 family tetracycline resistance protein-like MFS transporter
VVAKLLPILGITFIDILGFSILIPIMPYYVQHFGASVIMVGVLFSTFGLCQFVAGPVWGNVSDRIGRKAVLIISQVGATIGWVMLAFAPTLTWVFVARIVEGISGGNISVTQAYVADRVEPEQRARAYGYVGAAFSAGFVLGPAAGGLLLAKYGYAMPFLLAAALQVVTLIVTIFFLPESVAEKGETAKAASLRDIPAFLADPRVSPVLVQKLSYSLGLYAWFAAFALILHAQLGLDASGTSYLFAVFGIMSVVFQLFVVGNVTERIGTRNASNVGFMSAALFFALMPLVHNIPMLLITVVLFSLGLSLTNATIAALLTDAAPENARGTVLGVGSSMESISAIIMPTISTSVLAFFGSAWTASLSLLFVAIALALGLVAKRREVATATE